jgi:hypothetical protein
MLLIQATPAWAVETTATDNQNKVSVHFSKQSDTKITCGGRNQYTGSGTAPFLLVSWTCQYKDKLSGAWIDMFTAPAWSDITKDTLWHYTSVNPCSYVPNKGDWYVRGQADGYWEKSGDRHPFRGANALPVPSAGKKVSCT